MNILASMTPQDWDTLIKTWLVIATDLVLPVTSFVGAILGAIAYLKSKENAARLDRHADTINTVQRQMPPAPKQ